MHNDAHLTRKFGLRPSPCACSPTYARVSTGHNAVFPLHLGNCTRFQGSIQSNTPQLPAGAFSRANTGVTCESANQPRDLQSRGRRSIRSSRRHAQRLLRDHRMSSPFMPAEGSLTRALAHSSSTHSANVLVNAQFTTRQCTVAWNVGPLMCHIGLHKHCALRCGFWYTSHPLQVAKL